MKKTTKYFITLFIASYGFIALYFHSYTEMALEGSANWYSILFWYLVMIPSSVMWTTIFPVAIIRGIIIRHTSINWPTAKGEIIYLKLNEGNFDEVDYWELLYRYSVDGVEYQSEILKAGSILPISSVKNPKFFSPGKSVDVYYNPKDPSYGALVTNGSKDIG